MFAYKVPERAWGAPAAIFGEREIEKISFFLIKIPNGRFEDIQKTATAKFFVHISLCDCLDAPISHRLEHT